MNILLFGKRRTEFKIGWRRVVRDIFSHKQARLMSLVVRIIRVIIPVEIGFSGIPQVGKQRGFAFANSIEAGKYIFFIDIQACPFVDIVRCIAINHSRICFAALVEYLTEVGINCMHDVPYFDKFCLQTAFIGGIESAPELTDIRNLFLRQKRKVSFEVFLCSQIGKQQFCIDKVFVDIVKIIE